MQKKFVRSAVLAMASILSITAFAGSGAGTAFAAAFTESRPVSNLLPQSVIEDASNEAAQPDQYTIISPADVPTAPEKADLASSHGSLAALVSQYRSSQAANQEEHCLAIATYFEAKSEPLDGQLAVAQVVLNRAKSGRFASSVCGVVTQPSQFSFVRGGKLPTVARDAQQWRNAVAIAHIAREKLRDSSISNALYFHATRVSPNWRMNRIASIGNHIFYR